MRVTMPIDTDFGAAKDTSQANSELLNLQAEADHGT